MNVDAMAGILAGIKGAHPPEPTVPISVVGVILHMANKIDWKFLDGLPRDPELRTRAIMSELAMHLCNNPFLGEERKGLVSGWRMYTVKDVAKLTGRKPHAVRTAKLRGQLRTFDDPAWLRMISSQEEAKVFPAKKKRKDELWFHGLEVKRWCLNLGIGDLAGLNIISRFSDIQSSEAVEQRKELESKMAPAQSQIASLRSKGIRRSIFLEDPTVEQVFAAIGEKKPAEGDATKQAVEK